MSGAEFRRAGELLWIAAPFSTPAQCGPPWIKRPRTCLSAAADYRRLFKHRNSPFAMGALQVHGRQKGVGHLGGLRASMSLHVVVSPSPFSFGDRLVR